MEVLTEEVTFCDKDKESHIIFGEKFSSKGNRMSKVPKQRILFHVLHAVPELFKNHQHSIQYFISLKYPSVFLYFRAKIYLDNLY